MILNIKVQKHGRVVVVELIGDLDSNTSSMLEAELLRLMHDDHETLLVLECSHLDYMSSAGFRVLAKVMKELKETAGQLSLCSLKDYIREVFDLSGFLIALPVYDTLEEVLNAMAGARTG